MWVLRGIIFLLNIVGQTIQNICLPLALSGDDDMSVVFVYTTFIYFCFFSILDVLLDLFYKCDVRVSQKQLVLVSFHNTLNGLGAVFGGSSSRTPLTLQMSGSLLVNLMSPFYKMWVFGINFQSSFSRQWIWYGAACALYVISFVLTLIDKIKHGSSGGLSPYALLFFGGIFFGMTYNVHQDRMMEHIHFEDLPLGQVFKVAVHVLRKQLTWLFILSWFSVILAMIPTVDQSGPPTRDIFLNSWGHFLPFGNIYMDLFNIGYIVSFVTSIFMNKYDSSFNMMTSNISAVLSLWTGWVPSISMDTVGFVPNIPMTVTAMALSLAAIYPSYKYSIFLRRLLVKTKKNALESERLLNE